LADIHHHGLGYFIETIDELLGLQLALTTPDINDGLKRILLERARAREQKDWKTSDTLRDKLAESGVGVNDSATGSIWYYL
jgi:cysteinyl-tRNA synthetase